MARLEDLTPGPALRRILPDGLVTAVSGNFDLRHWRARSRIADIESGLDYLESHYREWGIQSFAVPRLGCGNGGLEWGRVRRLLEITFGRFNVPVELWVPASTVGYSAATAD